ncbi:MAG: dihydropteroate synthase [Campylobacterales bacterium]|nr:dihydropteroate synthase [Campylobacterales bacterium]
MNYYKINPSNPQEFFADLGADVAGSKIMGSKTKTNMLYIKDLHVGAANILKQDALSIGADLAVPVGTIIAKEKYVNAVLIGTKKHFEILSKKELTQPFGLKGLAQELKNFALSSHHTTKIMGVLNANDDSFFEKSRFQGPKALDHIQTMIQDGADIIDIGGVSTKPGSVGVSVEEELARVQPICDAIKEQKLYEQTIFSIDSYTPKVIEYALNSGFTIVNDITGLANDEVAKITAKYGATIVIMHMQGTPKDMQQNPHYEDVMIEVDQFFKDRIAKAKDFGIKNIILDVGIGFGKTLEHNLTLLRNLEHFSHFGYELLMGASRKSMIDKIVPSDVSQRLAGTLAIHLDSISKGASIIRCHDVAEHFQAIKVLEAIKG